MKIKNNGRIILSCIITMLVTAFFIMPGHTVTVDKHKVDNEIYYVVDLGSDGKWITEAENGRLYTLQNWINTDTGKSCVKLNGPIPFLVDSVELNKWVFYFWSENKARHLKNIARKVDD